MLLKKIIFICLLLFSGAVLSQKNITGVAKDIDGNLIASASVTIEEIGKETIIAYGITNSKGEYNITFTSSESNVNLKIKAFNYKSQVKHVANESQKHDFILEAEVIEIQEIKLKTQLITKRGDTISYNLKSFENKSDRTLSDVLKKIPGVDVSPEGLILYQGTAINKFYVNGKDLMEGAYGTINNSLPKDDVLRVEVLENHQPVKMLQDKIISEQAAINIKLKKKVSMTGRAELGSGYGDTFLWNAKLTPMFFGQKNQWVINYKSNNFGESVENEDKILAFGNVWEGKRNQVTQKEWLTLETFNMPNIPEKRYLRNNVHYLSINLLTNPFKNKEWELKANSNYTNNEVKNDSYSDILYFQDNNYVVNKIANIFYTNKFKTEVILTKNSKSTFFKNTSSFSRFWNIGKATTQLNSYVGKERLESPTLSFQNSLSAIIPWKYKMINVKSYFNYQTDNQLLNVDPKDYVGILRDRISSSSIFQDFNIKSIQVDQSANIGFSKNAWTFTPEVGLNYDFNYMNSNIYSIDVTQANPNDFLNDVSYNYYNPYSSLDINYKKDSWMFYFKMPLNFNYININDSYRDTSRLFSKITFEPIIYAQYLFASFWKTSLQSGINYKFGDISNIYSGNILLNPLNLTRMNSDNPLKENNNKNINVKIEYRNPFNNFFFNIGNRYSHSRRNLIANSTVINGAKQIDFEIFSNRNLTNAFVSEFGKYFPKLKTNSSISYGYTNSNDQQKYNGSLSDVETRVQSIGFKINNSYFKWLSFDYNVTYRETKQFGFSNIETINKMLVHKLNLFIYPLENHTVGFNWDQINSKDLISTYKNPFYDISYQFTYVKKKIDFELKWSNITNRSMFETYNLNSLYESYSRIQLRPRQITFVVKFNFN